MGWFNVKLMSHSIVYLFVHVNNLKGQKNVPKLTKFSASPQYFQLFPNIWHSFYELISWVGWKLKCEWCKKLFDWPLNIWRCWATKVSTFLREIFVRGGKKASKVVDDSRGKFWWIDRGSLARVVNPGFCCIPPSHPPLHFTSKWIAMASQIGSLAFSVKSLLERRKVQKCGWKVIKCLKNSRLFLLGDVVRQNSCFDAQCLSAKICPLIFVADLKSKDSIQGLTFFTAWNRVDFLDWRKEPC